MYESFDLLDGRHPWKDVSPEGYIDYPVRFRKGGRVVYFNFPLAREMGLIPRNHPTQLTEGLKDAVLRAFSIQVLNEYDWQHRERFPRDGYEDRLYMATRYLQLQHPNRQGKTSGDGRSIWNGCLTNDAGTTFDVSSRGTGNTILSPGAQETDQPIPVGDNSFGYASGMADLDEMLGGALMSEIFYQRGIPTERTLAVIAYNDNTAIGVRTAPNLIRPAHFFRYLKSGQWQELKRSYEYYLDRQERNRVYKLPRTPTARYRAGLRYICRAYARFVAQMEEEYIFNWLSWDGDNMLAYGAVLDYGSIRQFAAKHSKYRYDDVDRYSASLAEQKREARYILQTFVQMVDFIITKKKNNIKDFAGHALLKEFEHHYEAEVQKIMLQRIGFTAAQTKRLMQDHPSEVKKFRRVLNYFEDVKTGSGPIPVADGIDHPPLFLVRNILRELPAFLLSHEKEGVWPILPAEEFCRIMARSYLDEAELSLTPGREERAFDFQRYYMDLIYAVGKHKRFATLKSVNKRAQVINYAYRNTGDGLIWVVHEALNFKDMLDESLWQETLDRYIQSQVLVPGKFKPFKPREMKGNSNKARALKRLWDVLEEYKETI